MEKNREKFQVREGLPRILLRVSNNQGYVWDIDDVRLLRTELHLTGNLTGTLPQLSQQNVFLGLPLILMPEEVWILIEGGHAIIVDDVAAHLPPTEVQLAQFETWRREEILEQRMAIQKHENERKKKALESKGDEFKRIREERQKKKGLTPQPEAQASQETHDNLENIPYQINIRAQSDSSPWYNSTGARYNSLEEAKAAGVFSYPNSPLQRARCFVFRDLWSKNYFLGIGLRFGGDFLVYPGDTLRFHSHFTLTVLESPSHPIKPLDVISYGRLATAVKKAHLLGAWNEATGEAMYISLQWAGF